MPYLAGDRKKHAVRRAGKRLFRTFHNGNVDALPAVNRRVEHVFVAGGTRLRGPFSGSNQCFSRMAFIGLKPPIPPAELQNTGTRTEAALAC
jgi:hypothetical protein